jgi:aspartyl-tRNA(Asn)/glutamyl-tRNA(Gln) amidotransferase subunit C
MPNVKNWQTTKLQQLDTTGVKPLVYLSPATNVFREDTVANQLDQPTALQNAPKQDGQYFRVPKFLMDNV